MNMTRSPFSSRPIRRKARGQVLKKARRSFCRGAGALELGCSNKAKGLFLDSLLFYSWSKFVEVSIVCSRFRWIYSRGGVFVESKTIFDILTRTKLSFSCCRLHITLREKNFLEIMRILSRAQTRLKGPEIELINKDNLRKKRGILDRKVRIIFLRDSKPWTGRGGGGSGNNSHFMTKTNSSQFVFRGPCNQNINKRNGTDGIPRKFVFFSDSNW